MQEPPDAYYTLASGGELSSKGWPRPHLGLGRIAEALPRPREGPERRGPSGRRRGAGLGLAEAQNGADGGNTVQRARREGKRVTPCRRAR
eukprot:3133536-Rhodomonas_salina.1